VSEVEAAARRLVGCRFRLHGRDPATGLDCVGVVACATGLEAVSGYALRTANADRVIRLIEAAGLRRSASAAAGDVLLMRVGACQLHLAIRTGTGIVHADASLRRVVERPGVPEWEIIGSWRL
jgi:hypothetical protein